MKQNSFFQFPKIRQQINDFTHSTSYFTRYFILQFL